MTSPASVAQPALRPFGLRDKIGYMFGDFGNDFTFILQVMFFMVFYTNVGGIEPAHVGTLLLVARVLDAFTDVGMGMIVDRLKPARDGRFKPWIRRVAIPVAVASALMYASFIQSWDYGARLSWMIATYVLWGSICYTAINIPYGSMASVISGDPGHRASLSVFRSLGATLAGICISIALPQIVYKKVDGKSMLDANMMFISATVMAIFAVLFYAVLYFNVEERVQVEPKEDRHGVGKLLLSLVTNRALLTLVLAALMLLIGSLLNTAMASYLWLDYFNDGGKQSIASMVGFLPVILLAPFAATMSKKFGKRELSVVGMGVCGIFSIVLYFLGTHNVWVYIVLFTIVGFGLSVFNLLIWAFITDVIDYQEVRSGERDDGTVYAVYSWARKLGQAVAGGLGGWALGWIGYKASKGERIVQTPETLNGLYMLSTLVPGILYLLVMLVLMFWYPLSKSAVEENVAILAEKHASEKAEA